MTQQHSLPPLFPLRTFYVKDLFRKNAGTVQATSPKVAAELFMAMSFKKCKYPIYTNMNLCNIRHENTFSDEHQRLFHAWSIEAYGSTTGYLDHSSTAAKFFISEQIGGF